MDHLIFWDRGGGGVLYILDLVRIFALQNTERFSSSRLEIFLNFQIKDTIANGINFECIYVYL